MNAKFGHYDTITTAENIDDRVDDWHENRTTPGMEIAAHLGFSKEQYARWVESNKIPCQHTEGYWIQEGVSFRCYECQHQFQLADLPKIPRNIETWKKP